MKATFFNKPLEWNIETSAESWQQGSEIEGKISVKNHGTESVDLSNAGVGLAFADIKKVHARTPNALKKESETPIQKNTLGAGEAMEMSFSLPFPENCPISDKKSSYFLIYGRDLSENHLQLKVEPRNLYTKMVGLLDTFERFKVKEVKGHKNGVEYKLIPPTSREMANLDSLSLVLSMDGDILKLVFDFAVKKLETSGVTNKINKLSVKVKRDLSPRQYSLGKDMINQEDLLKTFKDVLTEVKMNNVF
jgi:hypothetical protein